MYVDVATWETNVMDIEHQRSLEVVIHKLGLFKAKIPDKIWTTYDHIMIIQMQSQYNLQIS